MTTAGAVAAELRRIADVLDKQSLNKIVKPTLNFYHVYGDEKEDFISLAQVFPRPFDKGDGYNHEQYTLTHQDDALEVYASIDRSKVCKMVRPAREAEYDCEPLLSAAEESELESAQ